MAKRLGGRKMRNLHKLPIKDGDTVATPVGRRVASQVLSGFVDVEATIKEGDGARFRKYEVRLADDPDNVVRKRN